MKKLITTLALLAVTPLYAQFWGAFINVEGKLDSNGEHMLQPQAFVPVYEGSNNLVFIDLRGYLRNPLQGGVSLGFGYRHMVTDNVILGANVFYDNETTNNENMFHQAGLGLELLTPRTELRMNFYLPQGKEKEVMDTQVLYGQITDGNFEVVYKQGDMESAMPGMDAVFTFNQPLPNDFYLNASVGGYMYFGGEFFDNVYGFSSTIGLEKDFDLFGGNATAYANVGYGWNNVDGHHGFGNVGLKIALGGSGSKKGAERQMYSSVERENDIKTNTRVVDEEPSVYNATTTINGVTYSGLTELGANDSNIEGTIEGLGEDSLVYLRSEDGVIHISSAIDLNDGQAIVGSGYVFEVIGPQGQKCYVITDSNQATEVFNDATDEAVFNLADKTTLANLNLSGNGPVVLYGENVDNADIVNINFDLQNGQTAVMINGGSNNNIENIGITADENSVGTTGMQVSFTNGTTIKNVEITGVQEGLRLENNSNLYVQDANIVLTKNGTFTSYGMVLTENLNTTVDGINVYGKSGNSVGIFAVGNTDLEVFDTWLGNHTSGMVGSLNDELNIDTITAENNEIGVELSDNEDVRIDDVYANNNSIGINISGGSRITLTDIVASNNDYNGINILNVNDVSIQDLTANNNGESGMIVQNIEDLALENVTANNNGEMGIFLYQVTNVTGEQVEVSGNLQDGLYVSTGSSISLDGLIADNNGGSGAYIMDMTSVFMDNVLSTNNLENGIAISDSMIATVRNSIVTGNAQGVFITNSSSVFNYIDIDNVAADENVLVGILIDNAYEVEIDNSTAENNWGDGIQIMFSDYVTMSGVVASYNGNIGIYFYDVFWPTTQDVTAEGNGTDFVSVP